MAIKVINFRVALKAAKRYMWREIELKESENLDVLIYSILSSFEAEGTHLFSLEYNGQTFMTNQSSWDDTNSIEPDKIKIMALGLNCKDKMTLTYDFGCEWVFDITVKGFREIDDSASFHPTIINGKGKGIIEDIYPWTLAELIKETNTTGKPADLNKIWDDEFDDEEDEDENEDENTEIASPWDYRELDLAEQNITLDNQIQMFRQLYS